jgi:DNA-binding transcriptional regulator YhcF (GntR family)
MPHPPRLTITIDRDLPVSVAAQVEGQIEYGVISGDIAPGRALPSVRDLAAELGASPVTISAAYRALAAKGLIRTSPGRGTFVREDASVESRGGDDLLLRALSALILRAERLGKGRAELIRSFNVALAQLPDAAVGVAIALVGIFPEATRAYQHALRAALRSVDTLQATTIDVATRDEAVRATIARADVVLTFAHRAAEVEALLADPLRMVLLRMVASRRTRLALASLDPTESVLLVGGVPNFLPTFRRGVAHHAAHIRRVRTILHDDPDLATALRESDVVIFGTGCEHVLDVVPPGVKAFEYRHEPDPVQIENEIRPRIEQVRAERLRATMTTP